MSPDLKAIELEAACTLLKSTAREILSQHDLLADKVPLNYDDRIAFSFSTHDLLTYLAQRPALCESILQFSYDKRYSPSTYIVEADEGYRVGWYENGYEQEKSFGNIYDAVADFVLFSWGMGRLEKEL